MGVKALLLWLMLMLFLCNLLFLCITLRHWQWKYQKQLQVAGTDDSLHLQAAGTGDSLSVKDLHSTYMMKFQPYHFVIQDHFTLPMPKATVPVHDLIRQQWMEELRDYLFKIPPNTRSSKSLINIVTCDSKYEDVLLNWLISAQVNTQPPLENVLVLALDQQLQRTLEEHGFDSVYVDNAALLTPRMLAMITAKQHSAFYVVMIARLTVMRFLNHWGYDAANYDADALILKNPKLLFYKELGDSLLIGSRGKFPNEVKSVFGMSLCAGMFMIKSSPMTEEFWAALSSVKNSVNDQEKINLALLGMGLRWNNATFTQEKNWVGRSEGGFVVTILHLMLVCRRWCEKTKKRTYFVWHHGGKFSDGKIERARAEAMWFLRENWKQVAEESTALGVEWLRDIRH